VNPTALLTASGISPALVTLKLPGVNLEQVVIRPAPTWLVRLWGKTISAMALRTTIYIRPDTLDSDPSALGPLIVHELVHVHQWAQLGVVGFLWSYLSGYVGGRLAGLSHQDAYRAIPSEVEAREIANQIQGPVGPL
jgi:hypothetical protein